MHVFVVSCGEYREGSRVVSVWSDFASALGAFNAIVKLRSKDIDPAQIKRFEMSYDANFGTARAVIGVDTVSINRWLVNGA